MGNVQTAEIDLSDRQLTSVTLEQLGASVALPGVYKILAHVKRDRGNRVHRLYLRRNQLAYLPTHFEVLLSSLTDLSLRSNELTEFPKEILALKHLIKLSLASNSISVIPADISKLRNLEWLNLASNTIDDLPEELAKCKRITHLDIQKNRFTSLPSCISRLPNLRVLLAHKNSISHLGLDSIASTLCTLNLSFNFLEAVPTIVYKLPCLEVLILSSNLLKEFPAELCRRNKMLTNLDLHTNKIQGVPIEISNLKRLRRLNIAINEIDHIPSALGGLASLEWLNMNDNKLVQLPESIGDLRYLIKFGIVQNQLECLPDSIGRLTQLSKLDMRRNKFQWLPGSILKLRDQNETTQTVIDNRDETPVRTLRPGIGSLKTILMGENEKLQYFEGIVCDAHDGDTYVLPSNVNNAEQDKLQVLHKVPTLSEVAARSLLRQLSAQEGTQASLKHYSTRQAYLQTLSTNIIPEYTRSKLTNKSRQCEGCLRLFCDSHIYVAELGCMGDTRLDVPVRFRMCSYRCAKIFLATDKTAGQPYEDEALPDGLEALDYSSNEESSDMHSRRRNNDFVPIRNYGFAAASSGKNARLHGFNVLLCLPTEQNATFQRGKLVLSNCSIIRYEPSFWLTTMMMIWMKTI
ncbi:hypothetical protein INT43_006933 [Umbelopsis isabellina]|uniref:Uncharacterized protein n=1 Tax=Mortierella isabellina TaxID=91625 RepID=A0A8H7PX63_MORIS|nr:hypothetical protein INT43_006933 [Umbelopsis isabellina]